MAMIRPWLRFFRVVNLPTVPGDVLAGAAAVVAAGRMCLSGEDVAHVVLASVASCALYLFGLADNDIVGASTDKGRPLPDGEISPGAARIARGTCLALGFGSIAVGGAYLASAMATALALVAAIMAYNRTKRALLMGLCRGLNVLLGASAIVPPLFLPRALFRAPHVVAVPLAVAAVWTVYIAAVTKYSEGEERDPERKRYVGALIGGIVYLQLVALIAFALVRPANRRFLVAGAVLLVALRVVKTLFPKVSAS